MIKSYKELINEGYTQTKIKQLLTQAKLFKISKGYYSDKSNVTDAELISTKYSSAILTLETALHIYFNDYKEPSKVDISTPHKSKKLVDSRIKQYFNTSPGYESGSTELEYNGTMVKIYSLEKLLIEFLRHKDDYDSDAFSRIISYFVKCKDKLSKEKIYSFADGYKHNDKIYKLIEKHIYNKAYKEAKNMKGIVLAGGSGTRLYPITQGVSKQLLPVYDKPMVFYPISVLMLAGIRDILIITTKEDQAGFIRALGDGSQFGVNFQYCIQPSPDGLAQAFILGEKFIDGDACALALGDNIFYGNGFVNMLENAVRNSQAGLATNFGIEVPDPERFGVMEVEKKDYGKYQVLSLEEKPKEPKSNIAVTGLYFYPNDVVEKAKHVEKSARGEYEITTLNNMYLSEQRLLGEVLGGGFNWYDTGTFDSLTEAATSIRSIEVNRGRVVACLEQIAYDNGWITREVLEDRARVLSKNSYGKYLNSILKREG